ncbi:hypothetical protein PENTCL1PPCAC_10355, partial [Pristionchus entomophagus]
DLVESLAAHCRSQSSPPQKSWEGPNGCRLARFFFTSSVSSRSSEAAPGSRRSLCSHATAHRTNTPDGRCACAASGRSRPPRHTRCRERRSPARSMQLSGICRRPCPRTSLPRAPSGIAPTSRPSHESCTVDIRPAVHRRSSPSAVPRADR